MIGVAVLRSVATVASPLNLVQQVTILLGEVTQIGHR